MQDESTKVKIEFNDFIKLKNKAGSKIEMNNTNQLRKDLVANVSHDLKTPLTMIKAYAEKINPMAR